MLGKNRDLVCQREMGRIRSEEAQKRNGEKERRNEDKAEKKLRREGEKEKSVEEEKRRGANSTTLRRRLR